MKLDLEGKTAVVTGAGRGIGLATTRALLDEDVRVAGLSRTITAELRDRRHRDRRRPGHRRRRSRRAGEALAERQSWAQPPASGSPT